MAAQPNFKKIARLRPDAKGRITLGRHAKGVSSFILFEAADGRLLLNPMIEIPAQEKWLFQNPKALASVKKGLEQSARGETRHLGSFASHIEESED